MATELPAPATPCRHTGQMYCSYVLHLCQCRLVAAAKMQTGLVRSSAYTRNDQKNITRKISWSDLPRVYHAQANSRELKLSADGYQPVESYPQPTHATKLALSTWKISWTDYASRKNYAQANCWKSVTSRRTENGTPHAEPRTALRTQNQQPAQPYSPTEINA